MWEKRLLFILILDTLLFHYVQGTQDDKYQILFPILSERLNILMGNKGSNKHISTH